jgi:uroporphyrinogen-III synthase
VRLLVTRPRPDGERTAAALRARGHQVLLADLLRIEAVPEANLGPGPWSAAILTSANAARAIERHPRRAELLRLAAFAVGRRTAEAARAAGFADVRSADGDARDLIGLVGSANVSGPLLYLAGEDRAGDLAAVLSAIGVAVETAVVYRAVAAEAFPPPVEAALRDAAVDGVLHLSRRSAVVYLDCAKRAGLLDSALSPSHYCLSRQVAGPLEAAGAMRVAVAVRPEEGALLDLIPSSH